MATLTINFPADKKADILDALRDNYGVPGATQTELLTIIENEVKSNVKRIYRDYMRKQQYDVNLD